MGLLYFDGVRQALDQAQAAVPFARRYIYHPGTKRLAAVYEDSGLTRTQANPVEADAQGNFPLCHLMEGSFHVADEDPKGQPLASRTVTVRDSVLQFGERQSFATLADLQADDVMSYQALSSRHQVHVGDHVRVAQTGFTYVVAPGGAGDFHVATAGGVRLYESGGCYSTVARLAAAVARGESFPQGMTVLADGTIYRFANDGNTTLAGLTGWRVASDAQLGARVDAAELVADTADAKADLALAAAASPIYADEASGRAATANGEVFLVVHDTALEARRNDGGSSTRLGWLGEVLYDDLTALMETAGGFQPGTVLRTRKDGIAYEVADHSVTDAHISIAGGTRLYEAGPYSKPSRLARTSGFSGEVRRLVGGLCGGDFVFKPGDFSAKVAKDPMGGVYVPPATDPTGASGCWIRQHDGTIRAEWFGATGGPDDTDAVQACDEFLREMDEAICWDVCDVYTTLGFGEMIWKQDYATMADAVAALPTLAEHDVIRVLVDETQNNARTRYRVRSGSFVGPLSERSYNGKSIYGSGGAKRNGFLLKAGAPGWMRLFSASLQDATIANVMFNGNNPSSQWGNGFAPKLNPDTELLVFVEGYGITWDNNAVRFSGGNGVQFRGIIGNFHIKGGDCVSQYHEGWGWVIDRMSSFKASKLWGEGNELGDVLMRHDVQTSDATGQSYWKRAAIEIESIYSENASQTAPIVQIEGGHFAPRIGHVAQHGTGALRPVVKLASSAGADGIWRGCHGGYFDLGSILGAKIICDANSRNNVFVRGSGLWSDKQNDPWDFRDSGKDNVVIWGAPDTLAFHPGSAAGDVSVNSGSSNFVNNSGSSAQLVNTLGGIIGPVQDYHSNFAGGPSHVRAIGFNSNNGGSEINFMLSLNAQLPATVKTWYAALLGRFEAHQLVKVALYDTNSTHFYNWDSGTWTSLPNEDDFGVYRTIRADRRHLSYILPFENDGTARTVRVQVRLKGGGDADLYHAWVTDHPSPALVGIRSGQCLGTPGNAVATTGTLAPANVVPVGTRVFNTTTSLMQVSDGTAWIAG